VTANKDPVLQETAHPQQEEPGVKPAPRRERKNMKEDIAKKKQRREMRGSKKLVGPRQGSA